MLNLSTPSMFHRHNFLMKFFNTKQITNNDARINVCEHEDPPSSHFLLIIPTFFAMLKCQWFRNSTHITHTNIQVCLKER